MVHTVKKERTMNRKELEERLIDFAVRIVKLANELPRNNSSIHLSRQIVRSGTAPALNYGEAQSAQSKKDFIHKMSIALKELRETHICISIIRRSEGLESDSRWNEAAEECNELVSIFVRSLQTARSRE